MPLNDEDTFQLLLRHIDTQGERLSERLSTQDGVLGEIRDHQASTNGKVAQQERDLNDIKLWRARLEGAKVAVGWIPPFITAVAGSGIGVLLTLLLVK